MAFCVQTVGFFNAYLKPEKEKIKGKRGLCWFSYRLCNAACCSSEEMSGSLRRCQQMAPAENVNGAQQGRTCLHFSKASKLAQVRYQWVPRRVSPCLILCPKYLLIISFLGLNEEVESSSDQGVLELVYWPLPLRLPTLSISCGRGSK